MNILANGHQCALVEKGGKCCEGAASMTSCRVPMYLFGGLVLAGLVIIIVLQSKTLKHLHKGGKKK